MDQETRNTLLTAQQALLHVHKALLEEERRRYEVERGRVPSAMAFLQLLLNDPWFAWIRPMSGLAAQIDEALFAKPGVTTLPPSLLLEEARFLLSPRHESDDIPGRLYQMIQAVPEVAVAHREAVKIWPVAPPA
ncbi:MAG: hypothetical protein ABJB33_01830 [Gemmatimonadota bacterium]